MATPEGRVKEAVKRLLKKRNIWFYMPVAGPFAAHGIPDFVCCYRGRFLGIETKAPGKLNATTENQKRVHEEIREHYGLMYVIDNVEALEHKLDILEELYG